MTPLWLLLPLIIIFSTHVAATDRLSAQVLLLLAPFPSALLYFAIQIVQISRDRPTPGRRLAGIKLVSVNDQATSFSTAATREIIGVFLPLAIIAVLNLWPLILIIPVVSLISGEGRGLADLVASTKVVALETSERKRPLPWEHT